MDIAFGIAAYEWDNEDLENTSETITLLTTFGSFADEVTYDDGEPWPSSADGTGPSLELCELYYDDADRDDGEKWQASTTFVTDTYDDGGGPDNTVFASPGDAAVCIPIVTDCLLYTSPSPRD